MTWEDNRRGASSEDGFIIADGTPEDLIPRNIRWHDNYMHAFTKDGVKIANLKKAITTVSSLPAEGDTEVFYRLVPGDASHKAGIYYWDGTRYVYDDALGLVTEHNTSSTSHADIRNAIQAMSTDMKYKGSVDDFEHLPADATRGDVYTTRDDGREYVYDGETWVELGRVVDVQWGGIIGDITDQTDLQNALGGKQDTLTAGANITIDANNEISATDTTYGNFVGATSSVAGAAGLVPAPTTADVEKFLKGDGTWGEAGGGVKTLTTADYNYPTTGTKTTVLASLLPNGVYQIPSDFGTDKVYVGTKSNALNAPINPGSTFVVSHMQASWGGVVVEFVSQGTIDMTSSGFATTNDAGQIQYGPYYYKPNNNLTTTALGYTLDARQGKVLKDLIDALDTPFTGTDGTDAGTKGLVPAPATTDAGKFLKADGTWAEAGGGEQVQSDWNDNDQTSPSYVKNRTHYDETPYFDSESRLGYYGWNETIFSQLPSVNGTTFDSSDPYMYWQALGLSGSYATRYDGSAGPGASVDSPYWDSAAAKQLTSLARITMTAQYDGRTLTVNGNKSSIVADNGETIYKYTMGGDLWFVDVIIYRTMVIVLIGSGQVYDSSWNNLIETMVIGTTPTTKKIASRFLPLATNDTPGAITLAQTVSSVGDGLEKTGGSIKVKAGLADYDENDVTSASHIENRPFYEYTTTSSQSLIDNTGFSHGGGVVPIDSSEYPPSAIMDDLTNRGISFGSYEPGAFWWSVSSATKQNILDAIDNGDDVVFSHIGGNWEDWEHEASGTVDLTFEVSSATELSNGEYAFDGTLKNGGTTISGAVVYLTDSSNWGRSFEDQTQGWNPYYGDLLAIFAQNLSWNVGYGSSTLPNIDNPWEWHIDSNSEVTVTKKLDSKFIKVDGETISVNTDGELEAQVSGTIKTLTTADYDYHSSGDADDGVALWKLPQGIYIKPVGVKAYAGSGSSFVYDGITDATAIITPNTGATQYAKYMNITVFGILSGGVGGCPGLASYIVQTNSGSVNNPSIFNWAQRRHFPIVPDMLSSSIGNNDFYTAASSAAIYTLNGNIGNLSTLTTTTKTSAVAAINEVAGQLTGLETALNTINNGGQE